MVAALQPFSIDDTQVQRHLPMGASILQREDLSALGTHQDDWIPGKFNRQGSAGLQLFGECEGIPEVGVQPDLAKVWIVSQSFNSVGHGSVCLDAAGRHYSHAYTTGQSGNPDGGEVTQT